MRWKNFGRGAAARWALAAGAAFAAAGSASAATFTAGAGTFIPNEELDTAGGRINVDKGNAVTLPAGTYKATTFNFDAGTAGDVVPFLAVADVVNYRAIAVGDNQNVFFGQDQSLPFGGSSTFTLLAPTTVYAGISNQFQNPVYLDNGTGPNTDHDGAGQINYTVVLGGSVPPDLSFSNPNLGRSYAFSVTIESQVPEPATLGIVAVGGVGLVARRRRRHA